MNLEVQRALEWAAIHFRCFARIGRWGTCVDCPNSGGDVFPEFCMFTQRHDHNLRADALAEQFDIRVRRP